MWSQTFRYCRRALSSSNTSAVDLNFNVKSQREMEQLGACIGRRLRLNDVMLLYGYIYLNVKKNFLRSPDINVEIWVVGRHVSPVEVFES